ncbi:SCO family protein [bacterium]|nr:SCO family protein [bacterium]
MIFQPNYRIALTLAACFAVANWGGFVLGQAGEDQSSKTVTETSKKSDPYGINEKPKVAQNIGVDSQTGEFIVRDITFHDEENRFVQIGKYFDGKRPVMLSFNYSDCPKLCSVQLENMTDTLRDIKFKVDEDFQMVSLSIDPTEQSSRAKKSKAKYVKRYSKFDRENSQDGWHFLTGDEDDIQLLADICGFRYKYVREQKLYSHPPVFILISPKGKIVRYIHGLNYDAGTIEQALVESAEGKIGSPINILNYGLGCFTFNESTGRYTFQAMAIMRIGGAFTAILLLGTLVPYWLFRRGTKKDDSDYLPTAAG